MIRKENLKKMSEVDIKEANASELVELKDVVIRKDLPLEKRTEDYIEQIGNPYLYKSNGITVKVCFAEGGKSLNECITNLLSLETGVDLSDGDIGQAV